MIGELRSVVLDCRDPRALAAFWVHVLGGTVCAEDDTWVVLTDPAGRRLAFQHSPEHQPPRFPDPRGAQQFHLDVRVDDIGAAEDAVLALGATRVLDAPGEDDFRVYRDPAGPPLLSGLQRRLTGVKFCRVDNIRGKTIVVTGAARGIGLATAKALLTRGARVVIGDRDVRRFEPTSISVGGAWHTRTHVR